MTISKGFSFVLLKRFYFIILFCVVSADIIPRTWYEETNETKTFKWEPPTNPNGIIVKYDIELKAENVDSVCITFTTYSVTVYHGLLNLSSFFSISLFSCIAECTSCSLFA